MIAILGKGFIFCLISSYNWNLQLLSFWGFYEMCDREATTTRGCHLGYTDTLRKRKTYLDFSALKTNPLVFDPIQDTLASNSPLSFVLLTFLAPH